MTRKQTIDEKRPANLSLAEKTYWGKHPQGRRHTRNLLKTISRLRQESLAVINVVANAIGKRVRDLDLDVVPEKMDVQGEGMMLGIPAGRELEARVLLAEQLVGHLVKQRDDAHLVAVAQRHLLIQIASECDGDLSKRIQKFLNQTAEFTPPPAPAEPAKPEELTNIDLRNNVAQLLLTLGAQLGTFSFGWTADVVRALDLLAKLTTTKARIDVHEGKP